MSKKFSLAVYVDNHFGVLSRVTGMFTRRGFNIDSLTVGETESPKYSRITITLSGDGYAKEQMLNQLRKLYPVKKFELLEAEESVRRELCLIKMKHDPKTRADVMSAVEVFRAKVIDYGVEALSIEVTGEPSKIDAFVSVMKPYGILEMCRTGIVAMSRGSKCIKDKTDISSEAEEELPEISENDQRDIF